MTKHSDRLMLGRRRNLDLLSLTPVALSQGIPKMVIKTNAHAHTHTWKSRGTQLEMLVMPLRLPVSYWTQCNAH